MKSEAHFVLATPARSPADPFGVALENHGFLRLVALGTRRGIVGIPPERTNLNPLIGLCAYAATLVLSSFQAESFRFHLLPWFDRWAVKQLQPGDHVISSYGYANECFAWVRARGGKTFIDAGNSHIEHYWQIVAEEYARWNCSLPPFPTYWYERGKAMLPLTDYVLSPSSFVTRSFLDRGFKPEQILQNIYPVDLDCFSPMPEPRPANRPLTIISTGGVSLRKGTPYLLEAFRSIRRTHPSARLLLTNLVHDSMRPLLRRWSDLPIEWVPLLPHARLAEHLRQGDVFVLPSLEDGFARTVTEALACGLSVVTTANTGACDHVIPGVNGEIVPLRDATAIATAVLTCFERTCAEGRPPLTDLQRRLSFATFEQDFLTQLEKLGLVPGS